MATPSLQLGSGNWAVKSDSLLGYKTIDSKYYPREMTFTRATTGTRVNAAGLVEIVPYNLFSYSEDFTNAAWFTTDVITVNTTTAPNGTLTADTLTIPSTTNSQYYLIRNSFFINVGQYTQSFYVKKNTYGYIALVSTINGSLQTSYFDINTGVVGTTTSGTTSSITDVGNGWYRVSQTATETTGANRVIGIYFANSLMNSINVSLSLTDSFYAWGAQLVEGTQPLTYLPTTDRLDIPRIDYSTGSSALLLETQRTNLALRSEDFNNGSWTKSGATVTSDSIVSPSGIQNADTITQSGGTLNINQTITISSVGNYTYTVYLKKGNFDSSTLFRFGAFQGGDLGYITFDFNTNTTSVISGTIISHSSTSLGNGWYRIQYTINIPAIGAVLFYNGGVGGSIGVGNFFYSWGAQLEVGPYPTSYIPTTSASVTRNADTCTKTGISSLIGQTEGTLYFQAKGLVDDSTYSLISLSDIGGANRISIGYANTATNLYFEYRVNSSYLINFNIGYIVKTDNNRIAVKYKLGEQAVFLNGVKIYSNTLSSAFTTALDRFSFDYNGGGFPYYGKVKALEIYTTSLTDAECIALTTL